MILLVMTAVNSTVLAHVADEISIRTDICFEENKIYFKLDMASGVLFSTHFLKTLDPDHNRIFEPEHIEDFSRFIVDSLEIVLGNEVMVPVLTDFSASEWNYFAAGISTIKLEYAVPYEFRGISTEQLRYTISFYPEVTIYTLGIENGASDMLALVSEVRNEFLQDSIALEFTNDPALFKPKTDIPLPPVKVTFVGKVKNGIIALQDFVKNGFERIGVMDFIRGNDIGSRTLSLLLGFAVILGFLHAFTPGHGKALVGAFLIANKGTPWQALLLGLVITVSHTISIYAIGLLASTLTTFFLPGEVVYALNIVCGAFIIVLGLWMFIKRLLGQQMDHAHLLPNLKVLEGNRINILIDGKAAQANETLAIALEDEAFQRTMKAAGAEDVNLCSPGCSTHKMMPLRLQEKYYSQFFKMAIRTGAVDAVVTASGATVRHLGRTGQSTAIWMDDRVAESPEALLERALDNYSSRGKNMAMPDDSISWGKIISLGVAGGIVPCPDALAVLLVAITAGKLYLGMTVILLFSVGLAAALVLMGMVVVLTKNYVAKKSGLRIVTAYFPYLSSLFITVLGFFMIKSSLGGI